jgi:hypothetical protein
MKNDLYNDLAKKIPPVFKYQEVYYVETLQYRHTPSYQS